MKEILPGLKTHIMGVALGVSAIMNNIASNTGASTLEGLVDGLIDPINGLFAGMTALIMWFRSLAS